MGRWGRRWTPSHVTCHIGGRWHAVEIDSHRVLPFSHGIVIYGLVIVHRRREMPSTGHQKIQTRIQDTYVDNPGNYCNKLKGLGFRTFWTVSDSFEQIRTFQIVSDSFGQIRIVMDISNNFGQFWTGLNSGQRFR
jgi:hypothetical protein